MAKTDLTLTLLLLEPKPFTKSRREATQFSTLDRCLMTKACGLLLKTYHPTKGGGKNVLHWSGKIPPLSSAPIFHSSVEGTKRLMYMGSMVWGTEKKYDKQRNKDILGGKKTSPPRKAEEEKMFLKEWNTDHHSFCSKARMLKLWQNILQVEKVTNRTAK